MLQTQENNVTSIVLSVGNSEVELSIETRSSAGGSLD